MPIGAVTMILTNVGLQIYNNWCSSRQNKQLQQKREEYELAARERNTQRMWQLMREGQELTKQLEEEKHQQRLKELKNDIGSLLQKLAYAATINNWPLNVLPIVMKNQALGNLLANQEESIALHCIFTSSNSIEFNRTVFPRIEEALEGYCNQHWSVMSDHPILFYSGAWKSQQAPSEVQIDSMRTALSNLPTLLITPFFRPNDGKLVFHVRIWGVGSSSSDEFSIPEIEPTEFQRDYQTNDDYVNDTELMDELIEDLVPYLQCLIGYMADTYFWSSLGKAPHLPLLVTNGTINTDGMKYLVDDSREYYDKLLLTSEENAKENPFIQNKLLNLYEGSAELWEENTKKEKLAAFVSSYNRTVLGDASKSLESALSGKDYRFCDLPFLINFGKFSSYLPFKTQELLNEEIERLNHRVPTIYSRESFPDYLLIENSVSELDIEDVLRSFEKYCDDMGIKDVSLLIYIKNSNEYHFHTYDDERDAILYYDEPFNVSFKVQSVKHQRNVSSLFSNSNIKQISCRLTRIEYLIERINSINLIY